MCGLSSGWNELMDARNDVQGAAQGGQVTRAGRTEGDTAGDAFDVADAAQGFDQGFVSVLVEQCADGLVTVAQGETVT